MPRFLLKRLCWGVFSLFFSFQLQAEATRILNVYSWAYVLTPEILVQFEKDTGIKVNYDVYDSSEVMETKLLAGNSGYDVVVVTAFPYLSRQIEAHLYQPLQSSLIPSKAEIDADLIKRMEAADPGNQHALPFLWGTTGFAFNRSMVLSRFPEAPVQSFAMLFDPSVVSRFADCGVMLLDSPVDVFPAVLNYMGKDPNSENLEDLREASKVLSQVKPFIKKFQAIPSAHDLLSGGYCVVEGFSGELSLAQKLGKENGLDIDYVIPKEGAGLWIDALAIPQDAPHAAEAHVFINFLLRPDIIAKVTNAFETANSIPSSKSFIEERILKNPLIYPSKTVLKRLYIDKTHSPQYERLRLREWMRVKIGR